MVNSSLDEVKQPVPSRGEVSWERSALCLGCCVYETNPSAPGFPQLSVIQAAEVSELCPTMDE